MSLSAVWLSTLLSLTSCDFLSSYRITDATKPQPPTSPDETLDMVMVHWYPNDRGLKIYHLKEYDSYRFIHGAIRSSDGSERFYNDTKGIERGTLFNDYIADVFEYSKHCLPDVSSALTCSEYLSAWYRDHGFDDQNGMQPS